MLKTALTPGSISCLVLCFVVWVVLKYRWPRNRRVGRVWFVMVGGGYFVLALPCVATTIIDWLPPVAVTDGASVRAVDTLVVFDGDNRRGRVREAVRVFAAARPATVVVLGDAWVLDALIDAGIPRSRLTRDDGPPTTLAQAGWVRRFVAGHPAARIGLVASRLQMPRVGALAKAAGLTLTLVPSPIDDEPPTTGARRFVPSYIALRASRDALYEHAALAYYRWRGWTGPAWRPGDGTNWQVPKSAPATRPRSSPPPVGAP